MAIVGDRHWLWAYVGDQVTVYDIAAGRGYRDAKAILGKDFAGVLERDGWAPYRRFEHAAHQTCVAHLLRRCSALIGDAVAGQAKVPHALRRILLDALAVRDEGLSGAALADRIAGLAARIDRFCARTPTHDPNRKLVGHVARERDHLLTFLTHDGVAATNRRAKQALRGMICNRKHWVATRPAPARTPQPSSPASYARLISNTSTPSTCSPTSNAPPASRPARPARRGRRRW